MATIIGTIGNNTLNTNLFEDDTINGLLGNDRYRYFLNGWNDVIYDTGGTDEIEFTNDIDFKAVALVKDGDDLFIDMDGAGSILVQNQYAAVANEIENLDFLSGLDVNLTASNLIVTQKLTNTHYKTDYGTSGVDIIFVGVGKEAMAYDVNNSYEVSTWAGAGNDIIVANNANIVWADIGDDTVYGNAGVIYLGVGNDIFQATDSLYRDTSVYGGDGNDIIHGNDLNDNVWGDYTNDSTPNNAVNPGDDIIYGYGGNDNLRGNGGNDIIYGGSGNDDIFSGSGNDTVYGDDGYDHITTGDGVDTVYGGNGDDQIIAGEMNGIVCSGQDIVFGGEGNDFIRDGLDSDILHGDNGHDRIYSLNGGNDFIYGDTGNDQITVKAASHADISVFGGEGDDKFWSQVTSKSSSAPIGEIYFSGGSGNDNYFTTHSDGGSGFFDMGDIVIYDGSISQDSIVLAGGNLSDINFATSGDDLLITFDNAIGSITVIDHFVSPNHIENLEFGYWSVANQEKVLTNEYSFIEKLTDNTDMYTATTSFIGSERNIIEAMIGDDIVYAGSGGDIVYGQVGDDILYGEAGNDTLYGGADNDILYGGAGNDELYGNVGDDILYGGYGIDVLYGDIGADIFVFKASSAFTNSDSIQDFNLSEDDKLDVLDLLNGYDPATDMISDFVQITDNGTDSYLSVDSDGGADNFVQVVTLMGITTLTDVSALETSGNLITA